jgi:hypothetical protein
MANTFNPKSNTWICDTAAAVTSQDVYVKQIRVVVPTGNLPCTVKIVDNQTSAQTLWEAEITAENVAGDLIEQWWRTGFTIATLDTGGTVYIDLG